MGVNRISTNNPKWANGTIDVSLVDGYNGIIRISCVDSSGKKVFAPIGKEGSEKAAGVFPLGCDICVARQQPPCGMKPSKSGCHAGTQFAPVPPCQYQTVGSAAVAVSWEGLQ